MHQGCAGSFENGQQVVDKLRMMGFNEQYMPTAFDIKCENCGEEFLMETFESKCPKCKMTYGVTPCHAFDKKHIKAAGINY
ncbi:MAG: hypothetical protein LDL10_06105 [Calditerrivibrio sp.]|nr:hypothetical protein [Calditerrivibrio sp.]MCA1981095.1 hypothetical protein [Calditerrivibrio sp.]